MKTTFITIITLLLTITTCLAQETVERRHNLTDSVQERFQVLKSDKATRQGLYQALYQKKTALASGQFDHEKKVGIWHFYDNKGQLIQNYNYDTRQVTFEALEDTTSNLRYFVDKQLTDSDKTTKPVKAGGRYYGYLPYLKLFKLPANLMDLNRLVSVAIVELLVSPGGRLADYKVHIISGDYKKALGMNIDALNEEDKVFIPATVNDEPISCRILIKCSINDDGTIDYY